MGVKIAVYPKCFEYDIGLHHTMSVFEWIALAKKELHPIEGLELYDRFLTNLSSEYICQVRDSVQEAGFSIPMFICSPDFTHPDPGERQRSVDYEAKMIEVAYLLGGAGTVCRILSGQQRPTITRQQGVEWVVEAIEKLIPVARQYQIILGMENHYKDSQWSHPEFALKMDVFLEIINAIKESQHFGVQFDPSNAIVAGDDPIALLEAVKERVVSMHASDRYIREGVTPEQFSASDGVVGYATHLCHGVVGKGLNDYERIFAILKKAGFNGWISIEDGMNGIEEIQQSAEYLFQLRKKYYDNQEG